MRTWVFISQFGTKNISLPSTSNMNRARLLISTLLLVALIMLFTQESEGYIVSLTQKHFKKRYLKKMNRRLLREVLSDDSQAKKMEYFEKWLKRFERKRRRYRNRGEK